MLEDPTSGRLLYPRLSRSEGLTRLKQFEHLSPGDLRKLASLEHPQAAVAPTGGVPASTGDLEAVQFEVRAIADAAGFPNELRGNEQAFDRPCGTGLRNVMNIVPADAASEDVWTFLSVVVLPEIGPWRFPKRAEERMLGRPRNVMRRLWWRAWALGPDLDAKPEGCTPLGEDEFVGIMERPSIGGNPNTAQAVCDAIWRAEANGLSMARSEFARQLTRRFRGIMAHVSVDALDDRDLAVLLDEISSRIITETAGG